MKSRRTIEPFYDDANPSRLLVGARYTDGIAHDGPVAVITHNADWLNICTDRYEGNAMLNIEALPHLRKALARIARDIAKAKRK